MALNFGSFVAGFARQGTADFEREETMVSNLVSKSFDKWLVDGPAAHKAQRARKKELRRQAKILASYNLSPDKVGVILEQGRADEVIKYLGGVNSLTGNARKAYLEPLGGDIGNIVKFADGYEESGMTIDQIINKVGGKISGGMSLSDAFADVGQKKETTLANLLSPNVSNIVSKRKKMYESIYGKGSIEAALSGATGTVETEGLGLSGQVFTPDPEKSARIEQTLDPSKDFRTASYAQTNLKNFAASLIDGGRFNQNDGLFIPPSITKKHKAITKNALLTLINKGIADKSNTKTGNISDASIIEIQETLTNYVDQNMNKQVVQEDDRVKNLSVEGASNELKALEDKVSKKLVNDSGKPGSISYTVWQDQYARLLVKLKRAPNIDVAKSLAYKEFGTLTKQRKVREQSIGTEDDTSIMQP
jgi:hypothetical protein